MTPLEAGGWLLSFIQTYGYIGTLLLSFLSNLVPFIPVPYLLLVFFLSTSLNPVLLGIVGGVGAASAKVFIYLIGYGGRKLLNEKQLRKLDFAKLFMKKYGDLAIFIMAATPSPDDVLYIPLGMMAYSIYKFFFYCFLGKVAITLTVTLGGYFSISIIAQVFESGGGLVGLIVAAVFGLASIYATVKLDWETLFLKYASERDGVFKKLKKENDR